MPNSPSSSINPPPLPLLFSSRRIQIKQRNGFFLQGRGFAVNGSRGNSGRPSVSPSSSLPFLSGCQVRRKRKTKAFAFFICLLPRSAPDPSRTPEPDPIAAAPGHLPPLMSRWTAWIHPARHSSSLLPCWDWGGCPDVTTSLDERLWWALDRAGV